MLEVNFDLIMDCFSTSIKINWSTQRFCVALVDVLGNPDSVKHRHIYISIIADLSMNEF